MSQDKSHDWKCVSSGMYDSLYRCTKCGAEHTESADNRESWLVHDTSECDHMFVTAMPPAAAHTEEMCKFWCSEKNLLPSIILNDYVEVEKILNECTANASTLLVYMYEDHYVAEVQLEGFTQILRKGATPLQALLNLTKEVE